MCASIYKVLKKQFRKTIHKLYIYIYIYIYIYLHKLDLCTTFKIYSLLYVSLFLCSFILTLSYNLSQILNCPDRHQHALRVKKPLNSRYVIIIFHHG